MNLKLIAAAIVLCLGLAADAQTPWSATVTYSFGGQVTYAGGTYQSLMNGNFDREPDLYIGAPVIASSGSVNLYNPASAQNNSLGSDGPRAGYSFNLVPVTPGQTYTINQDIIAIGCTFVNTDGSDSGIPAGFGYNPAGNPMVMPAGSYTQIGIRLGGGAGSGNVLAATMLVSGTTLPSSYVAYGGVTPPSGGWELIQPATGVSPAITSGFKYAWMGDSISSSSFQMQLQAAFEKRTGMTAAFNDNRPGRHTSGLWENYGIPEQNGSVAAMSPQTITVNQKGSSTYGSSNSGTNGNTFSQDISAADIFVLAIGTNDGPNTGAVGTASDAPTAPTLAGQYVFAIKQVMLAKPTIQFYLCIPHISSYVTASQHALMQPMLEGLALRFGLRVIYWQAAFGANEFTDPSILVPGSSPTNRLQSDGVHPLPLTFIYGGDYMGGNVISTFSPPR